VDLWLRLNLGFPKSHNLTGEHEGKGSALKPAWEIFTCSRKPLIGTIAQNVEAHGTGALNIDACRVGWSGKNDKDAGRPASFAKSHPGFGEAFAIADRSHRDPVAEQHAAGRWPPNLTLSPGAAQELDRQSGHQISGVAVRRHGGGGARPGHVYDGGWGSGGEDQGHGDSGGASRYFPRIDTTAEEHEARFRYAAKPSAFERSAGIERKDDRVRGNTHPT